MVVESSLTERVPSTDVVEPSVSTESVAEIEVPSVVSAVIVVVPSVPVVAVPVATDKPDEVEEVAEEVVVRTALLVELEELATVVHGEELVEVEVEELKVVVLSVSLIPPSDPSLVEERTLLLVETEDLATVVDVVPGEELVEVEVEELVVGVDAEEDVEEAQILTIEISAKPMIGFVLDSPSEQLTVITNGIPVASVGVYVAVKVSQGVSTPAATPTPAAPTVTESIAISNSHCAVTDSLDM